MPDKIKNFVYINADYEILNQHIHQNEIGILINKNSTESIVRFINHENIYNIPNTLIESFDPEKTGDQFLKKICNICNRLLSVDEFQKNQNGKNNRTVRRPSCNACRKNIDGVALSGADKNKWNKLKPHLQIWECPICKKTTIPGLTSKVVLDHDHSTGKPRAWICDSCNTGLGRFKDDIEIMQNAIEYLKKCNTSDS